MNLLSSRAVNATVTLCHTATRDLSSFTRDADIIISAAGKPGLINSSMTGSNQVIIDVGTTRVADGTSRKGYRLAGDVDLDSVISAARAVTPVPGGIGPMTVAMLMKNTFKAYCLRAC